LQFFRHAGLDPASSLLFFRIPAFAGNDGIRGKLLGIETKVNKNRRAAVAKLAQSLL
jgi:hypothetical protein